MRRPLFVLALLLAAAGPSLAAEHVVSQKNKNFSIKKLTVAVGDTVKFQNDDPFAHNIFRCRTPRASTSAPTVSAWRSRC